MQKVIQAASGSTGSFAEASKHLSTLAEVDVSAKRIERLVTRIGNERIADVQQAWTDYQATALPERKTSPVEVTPELACIQVDGGRLQIRDRKPQPDEVTEATSQPSKKYWRESKVGTLLKMTGQTYREDPCPQIPQIFVDPARIRRLTREIKGFSADGGQTVVAPQQTESSLASEVDLAVNFDETIRPTPLVRSVIATAQPIKEFGNRLVGAAYQRGFMAAKRKAFVCDGMSYNWTLHAKHFEHFTPILDVVHAICYIYQAALGGQPCEASWQRYCQWAQLLWSGQPDELLNQMTSWQAVVGKPKEDDPEGSPRVLLADAIRYVSNQKSRMKYDQYRCDGLPTTSCYVESTIKMINRRVKGTEKFWSKNADPILQLRADAVSETNSMDEFWKKRPAKIPVSTHYNMAG